MADYFDVDSFRDLPDLVDSSRFSDERLEAARDWIVAVIERECETSFVHRSVTERLTGNGQPGLILSDPYVVSVESVTVDGTDYTSDELDALFLDVGFLWQPAGSTWPTTARGNVEVTYTAGYSEEPPADLREAAMRGARWWLLSSDAWSGKDARSTSITNDYGNIELSVAGENRPTGLPDVDATIMAWKRRVRVPKVS